MKQVVPTYHGIKLNTNFLELNIVFTCPQLIREMTKEDRANALAYLEQEHKKTLDGVGYEWDTCGIQQNKRARWENETLRKYKKIIKELDEE